MKDTYLTKEWRTDNRPMPMAEVKLDQLIKDQVTTMRTIQDSSK